MKKQKYEDYWEYTAALTKYDGEKFLGTLGICVQFIDKYKSEKYSPKKYTRLQNEIKKFSNINLLSIRKSINQLVKLGFILPFLKSYHPDTVEYIKAKTSNRKRKVLLSKIVYSHSNFNRAVNKDSKLNHVSFLINTLVENGQLTRSEVTGLMLVDISKYPKAGYIKGANLKKFEKEAISIDFIRRKYNQVSHICNLLSKLSDIIWKKNILYFTEDAERIFGPELYAGRKVRIPFLHKNFKDLLYIESNSVLVGDKCMVEKLEYPVLIASHIKPFIDSNDDEAYDVNNGFLLSKNIDSLFDLGYITFDNNGKIIFSKKLPKDVSKFVSNYSLEKIFLNEKRKEYLSYHRENVFEKRFNATA